MTTVDIALFMVKLQVTWKGHYTTLSIWRAVRLESM